MCGLRALRFVKLPDYRYLILWLLHVVTEKRDGIEDGESEWVVPKVRAAIVGELGRQMENLVGYVAQAGGVSSSGVSRFTSRQKSYST